MRARARRAYMSGEGAVALPERVRSSLLRGGKESDADWHARATEAATDAGRVANVVEIAEQRAPGM